MCRKIYGENYLWNKYNVVKETKYRLINIL